ncbi:hypothetical protein GM418_26980 [Maribellus comscasis]|uniref:Uncharacterized protein n=1 Tax=Maribellus comscasis TaxID=2681766 RepID=A0A6I6JVJ6_9BACT|nr:hypothetical protein [Maribellus comscasis]QGY47175.1 hypothetical protein GM418_26980 [Maribellus comscasis]
MKQAILFVFSLLVFDSCVLRVDSEYKNNDIIIENKDFCLVLRVDGTAKSLRHKESGEECLQPGLNVPAFSLIQYRPYDNELQLSHPAKAKTFPADSVYWKDGDLIVRFRPERNIATIGVEITDSYIAFKLKKFDYDLNDFRIKRQTRVDEFTLMQLPIRDRSNFGEWLNVSWDEDLAINLLATDHYAKIDAEARDGYRIFKAGMENNVKMEGVGAALITTRKNKLLDCIDQLEHDYNLPLGVESRRSKGYNFSYYELGATVDNIDEHIAYAKKGGFRAIQIVASSFAATNGHFPWKSEFPRGMKDLQEIIGKIKDAGMLAGLHIWYNKADTLDAYVTPVPDYRLNLRRNFLLARRLDEKDSNVYVEENPEGCTMEKGRRILRIGNELIEYEGYTTEYPYLFYGCKRGDMHTQPTSHKRGTPMGLLDVDTWTMWVRFNQRTSIQKEVAERIGKIWKEAGFDFIYYDGAEDIHRPYWFYTSKAQIELYNQLNPKPLFGTGALRSHFGWHILTRGNAFDVFSPEVIKAATNRYPLAEARIVSNDFTAIDFGWIDYLAPSEKTIGMQPDMYEYVCSKGAAWDCSISIYGRLEHLKKHPRTDDNLEVIKRWEDARLNDVFTQKQKDQLKDPEQEYILLIDETGKFELQPYEQLKLAMDQESLMRAFVFNRLEKTWVVYWHTRGEGSLKLHVKADRVQLFAKPGQPETIENEGDSIVLPVGKRRYLEFDLSEEKVIDLFRNAGLKTD